MGIQQDPNRKRYIPPTATKLTLNQAKQLVVNRANISEEEAANFLESLGEQKKPNVNEGTWKRSA